MGRRPILYRSISASDNTFGDSRPPSSHFNNQYAGIFALLLNMNLLVKLSVVPIFFLPLIAGWAGTQEESKVVEQPPVKKTEPWQITVGGSRLAGRASGHIGFHGVNPYVSVGVEQTANSGRTSHE
jgi:hypothetical protein